MIVNVSKKILLFWILQLQFIDTVIERQPKLRRQRCIFTKERGTDEQPMNRRRFHLLFLYMLFWNSSHTFLLLADISMYLFFLLLREELSQSGTDEHEFFHMGSSDDEHPASLQLLQHVQLIPLYEPRPRGQQHPTSNWEGASNHHSTAKVRNDLSILIWPYIVLDSTY